MTLALSRSVRRLLLPVLLPLPLLAQDGAGNPEESEALVGARLERPILYARVPAPAVTGGTSILHHPVFAGLSRWLATDGGGAAMWGDLASRAVGPVEIAWTGTFPAPAGAVADRPLLLFRAALDAPDAERLAGLLAGGRIASPHRLVAGHRTYRMVRDGSGAGAIASEDPVRAAGTRVEVVVAGTDLIVSNHGRALEEVLGAVPLQGPALIEDPEYLRLRRRLDPGAGGIQVFANVGELLRRASWDPRPMPAPRHALAVLEPEGPRLAASVILDLGEETSWSETLRPARVRDLTRMLRGGGLVLSVVEDATELSGGGSGVLGGRGAAPRTGAGLGAWRWRGGGSRADQEAGTRVLVLGGAQADFRAYSLLDDLGRARREVLGIFALGLAWPGGGATRWAGSIEPDAADPGEAAVDRERLLRVRALWSADG